MGSGGRSNPTTVGRSFSTYAEAQAFFNTAQQTAWEKSLKNNGLLSSVREYTGTAYRNINKNLKNGNVTQTAADIYKAIEEYYLPEDITVYRGCGGSIFAGASAAEINACLVGKEISQPQFLSTCAVNGEEFSGDYLYEITVPKGKGRGCYVDNISLHKGEIEFIIQLGAKMVITGAKDAPSNWQGHKTIVQMTMVG